MHTSLCTQTHTFPVFIRTYLLKLLKFTRSCTWCTNMIWYDRPSRIMQQQKGLIDSGKVSVLLRDPFDPDWGCLKNRATLWAPTQPYPFKTPSPPSLNVFGIWMFVWWKFPFCSPFLLPVIIVVFCLCVLQVTAGRLRGSVRVCVLCACACVCAGTCVFLTQPVFGAESAPDATQKDNERAGTVAAGSWAATQSDPGGAALVCV